MDSDALALSEVNKKWMYVKNRYPLSLKKKNLKCQQTQADETHSSVMM